MPEPPASPRCGPSARTPRPPQTAERSIAFAAVALALALVAPVSTEAAGVAELDRTPAALPPAPDGLSAAAAVVMDAFTGEVLFAKSADAERPVASTQKLLTALMIIEKGGLDEPITVQASDASVAPTRVGIKKGDTYSRRQLLTALLVKSGNDLAHCLARDYAGSEAEFADLMTKRGELLGMQRSVFKNASGLPAPGQKSCARDIAKLARAAYYNPTIREMTSRRDFTFVFNDGKTKPLSNTNRLLKTTGYTDGMKTGFTNAARHCLVSSASFGSRSVIAVVLGAPTRTNLWADSKSLLEWALQVPPDPDQP